MNTKTVVFCTLLLATHCASAVKQLARKNTMQANINDIKRTPKIGLGYIRTGIRQPVKDITKLNALLIRANQNQNLEAAQNPERLYL